MRRWLSAALAAMGVLLFLGAAVLCSRLEPLSNRISGLYENRERAIAAEEAFQRQREGELGMSVTWWQKKGRESLKSSGTGRSVQAEVLALCGRSDRLCSDTAALDYDQTSYCLLGRRTASELFGSSRAAGLQVEYEGRAYRVKAVCGDIEDAFIYEAGREAGLTFSRLTAACDDAKGQAIVKNKVTSLFMPDRFLDYCFLTFLAELFLMLIPAAAGCRVIALYRDCWKKEQGIRRLLIQAAGFLALAILAKFISLQIQVPADCFPPRWSDFVFWTELWKEKKAAVLLLFETELAAPDLVFLRSFGKTILLGICSMMLFAWAGKLRKAD